MIRKLRVCNSHPHFQTDKQIRCLGPTRLNSQHLRKEGPHLNQAACSSRDDKVAIVIVDHGSRRSESNQQLEEFVELYRRSHNSQLAIAAHMEIAKPSIKDAVNQCAEKGCSRVVVAPYFLSQGRHIQEDIPALVAEAQAEHPELHCIIAEPIVSKNRYAGIDKTVVDIIDSRVTAAMARSIEKV